MLQPSDWVMILGVLTIIGNILIAFVGKRPSGDAAMEQQGTEIASLRSRLDTVEKDRDRYRDQYYDHMDEWAALQDKAQKLEAANEVLKAKEASWAADRDSWAEEKKLLSARIVTLNNQVTDLSRKLAGLPPEENGHR